MNLEDLKKSVEKQYGMGDVVGGYDVIPTGSIGLDMATGIGGFPLGRIVETFAQESCGKTFIAQKVCANAIKMGLKVAYIDAEYAIDPDWAKFNGFDLEDPNVLFFQPDTVEDACNITDEIARSGLVSVIVIDSLSALVPEKEFEAPVGTSTIGVKARLLSQFLRKIKGTLRKNNVLLLTIGQMRDSIGGISFGDSATTDYGNGMKFTASMQVRYWRGIEKDKNGNPIANKTTAKVKKNKCATPFGVAKYQIVFGEGIDNDKEIVEIALDKKVITKNGAWYKMNGENIGQGSNGVKENMNANLDLKNAIIDGINKSFESSKNAYRIPLATQSDELGEVRELQAEN